MPDSYPRKEGEEVVLLVVDDVLRVPLLPLLWVAQPHSAGPEVSASAASRPRTAPETKMQGECWDETRCGFGFRGNRSVKEKP